MVSDGAASLTEGYDGVGPGGVAPEALVAGRLDVATVGPRAIRSPAGLKSKASDFAGKHLITYSVDEADLTLFQGLLSGG